MLPPPLSFWLLVSTEKSCHNNHHHERMVLWDTISISDKLTEYFITILASPSTLAKPDARWPVLVGECHQIKSYTRIYLYPDTIKHQNSSQVNIINSCLTYSYEHFPCQVSINWLINSLITRELYCLEHGIHPDGMMPTDASIGQVGGGAGNGGGNGNPRLGLREWLLSMNIIIIL